MSAAIFNRRKRIRLKPIQYHRVISACEARQRLQAVWLKIKGGHPREVNRGLDDHAVLWDFSVGVLR